MRQRGKLRNTRALGAQIVTYDRFTEDRVAIAEVLAKESGATIVPSFDDPWVIEGQGSAAVEAAAQLHTAAGLQFDQIIACCGGAG